MSETFEEMAWRIYIGIVPPQYDYGLHDEDVTKIALELKKEIEAPLLAELTDWREGKIYKEPIKLDTEEYLYPWKEEQQDDHHGEYTILSMETASAIEEDWMGGEDNLEMIEMHLKNFALDLASIGKIEISVNRAY